MYPLSPWFSPIIRSHLLWRYRWHPPRPYEITAQIGAGGMGEVYRATDTNLARRSRSRCCPTPSRYDPDRLARFEREAKTLASLNHPNIAQIYGLERPTVSVRS